MAGPKLVKLPFKVRLCVEEIPHHAHQAATIHKLLPQDTLLECIDYTYHSDNEVNCCCAIVWSCNPNKIPKKLLST
jgi:hypothetical protein